MRQLFFFILAGAFLLPARQVIAPATPGEAVISMVVNPFSDNSLAGNPVADNSLTFISKTVCFGGFV